MRRCGGRSSPVAAPALLLPLLVCFFHCAAAAAARPLPPAAAAAPPLQVHQGNGVTVAADGELAVLQRGAAGSGGDELSLSVSDEVMMGAAEEDPAAECDDGCLQRRMLRDAHLDYIYTQHKGKP